MQNSLFDKRIDCLHNLETVKALQGERITFFSCTFITKGMDGKPRLRHITATENSNGHIFNTLQNLLIAFLIKLIPVFSYEHTKINEDLIKEKHI